MEEDIKLECLKLAQTYCYNNNINDYNFLLSIAENFYNFVKNNYLDNSLKYINKNIDLTEKQVEIFNFIDKNDNSLVTSKRGIGSSTCILLYLSYIASKNVNKTILVVAPSENMSYELYNKTLNTNDCNAYYPYIEFKNSNSKIYFCNAINEHRYRGYNIDYLYVDSINLIPKPYVRPIENLFYCVNNKIIIQKAKEDIIYKKNDFNEIFITHIKIIKQKGYKMILMKF